MKKAQAAMEFLMTYGWAIFIVLGAIAALTFSGVLNPGRFLPDSCTFPSGFTCVDTAVISSSSDYFDFALKNDNGFSVNITGILDDSGSDDDCSSPSMQACTGVGCTPASVPNGIVFDTDQKGIIRVSCSSISNGRFSADVVLQYSSSESGLVHKATGEIRGQAS